MPTWTARTSGVLAGLALLGSADVVGCGGLSADAVGRTKVYAVQGVSPASAVVAVGQYHGVYVAETLPTRSWPPQLRKR